MVKGFFDEKEKGTFNLFVITLVFFSLNGLSELLTPDLSYYWLSEFILILLQGGVLAFVQNYLNIYWKAEEKKLAKAT